VNRTLAALFATAFLVGNFIALVIGAYGALFFPDENPTPQNTTVYDGVLVPAIVTFLIGVVIWIAVIRNRRWLALGGLFGHIAAASILLLIALRASEHSDGKLIVFGLVVEGIVAIAVILGTTALPRHMPS
jgi:hypothetical protein